CYPFFRHFNPPKSNDFKLYHISVIIASLYTYIIRESKKAKQEQRCRRLRRRAGCLTAKKQNKSSGADGFAGGQAA
ncbi:MAG: hypothetical protein FWG83_04065, partial [Oscillospiraceae bacterium]|nr:hypothetical protein [Oscillospiraceae bacterium]